MRMSVQRGKPDIAESSIETPVTPPSMKPLDNRKPFKPNAVEKIPKTIRPILKLSLTALFISYLRVC
jgi:hypothetical protein